MRKAWALVAVASLVACTREEETTPPPAEPAADAEPVATATASDETNDTVALEPVDASGVGGVVALARLEGRTLAFMGDADGHAVVTFDVDARSVLSITTLPGAPAQLLLARGLLFVAIRDQASLEVLEASQGARGLVRRGVVSTPSEPVGLAVTPDGATVLVATRWGHALSAYSTSALERRFEVSLARDSTAVAVSADGSTAYVAHAVGGRMSVVDLERRTVREIVLGSHRNVDEGSCGSAFGSGPHPQTMQQSFSLIRRPQGVLAPGVLVDPIPILDGVAVYGGRWWSKEPSTSFVVASVSGEDGTVRLAPSPARGFADCLLPRAAAIDETAGELYVTCLGRDVVAAYDVTKPTARAKRVWKVGAGPTGIAIEPEARRAVVWSQFDREVSVVSLGDRQPPRRVAVLPPALDPELDLGRRLFHAADGSRIAFDGRACASCHLEGRDDGLTWSTRDGPRQTPMLVGRLPETAPYGWAGADATLSRHFSATLDRLGGMGLSPREVDALFAWVRSLPAPARAAPTSARWARGRELFHADEVGCASCHTGETTTDRASHDVGTGSRHDAAAMFDTPSLRFVGGSAPYLHDGRYATMGALLEGMDGKMGFTKALSAEDRAALAEYVESL